MGAGYAITVKPKSYNNGGLKWSTDVQNYGNRNKFQK